jgi:hypothetical protein
MAGLLWTPDQITEVATAIQRNYGLSRRLDVANLTCSEWGQVFKHCEPHLKFDDTSFTKVGPGHLKEFAAACCLLRQ